MFFEFKHFISGLFIFNIMCEALIDVYHTIIEVYNGYDSMKSKYI